MNKADEGVQQQVAADNPVLQVCPRCGRDMSAGDVSVSEEVMQEYTRCMLGQIPFTKTVTLMHGAATLTFEAMSAEQSEVLKMLIRDMTIDQIIDAKLLATLKQVSIVDPTIHVITDLYTADAAERLEYCKKFPEKITDVIKDIDAPMLGVIRRAAIAFDVLCNNIKEQLCSSDFYEGIGLL